MTRQPPYRDGRLHVMADRCSSCVFRPGNPMRLEEGRLADLVEANVARGAALICHQTTYEQDERGEAVCRGFADAYADDVPALRFAEEWGLVTEQEPRH